MNNRLDWNTVARVTRNNTAFNPRKIYTRVVDGTDIYTVYSLNLDGSGFIICSSTYHLPPVIGYSLNNHFSIKGRHQAEIDIFIENIDTTFCTNRQSKASYKDKYKNVTEFLFPLQPRSCDGRFDTRQLITTEWGQGFPYNLFVNGVTGCVPTSTAQVMKYHNYPVKGEGVIPAYDDLPAIDIEGVQYQWRLMKDDGGDTPEEHDAVSRLMLHVGCAEKTDYRGDSAATATANVIPAVVGIFKYSDAMSYTIRPSHYNNESTFSRFEYESILKNNLQMGRPLMLGGNVHSIVCDGFDDNGLFHLNFGWNGNNNGYYDAFTNVFCNDEVISNIMPPLKAVLIKSDIITDNTLVLGEVFEASVIVHNVTDEDFSGDLALAVCDKSGAIIHILPAVTCHISACSKENILFNPILPDFLTVNDRALHVMMRSGTQENVWGIISGEHGNSIHAVQVVRKEKINGVFLKASLPEGVFYKGQINKYKVEVINQGDEDAFNFVLAFVDRTTNITYVLSQVNDYFLKVGLVSEIDFDAVLPDDIKAGDNYTLMIFCDNKKFETENVNAFDILPGVNDTVTNFSNVLIKSDFKYNPAIEIITQPDFPAELSARNPVEFTITIKATEKIMAMFIYASLIDENGRETMISHEELVNGVDANELREVRIVTKINKEFPAGHYFAGISCKKIQSSDTALLQPVENVKNPVDVTVLPVIQSPNIKLTQPLRKSITLHPQQKFRVLIYPRLMVKEYDGSAFYGQFSVYLITEDGEKILLGQERNIIVAYGYVGSVGISCVTPDTLHGNTGSIIVEASDDLYPEIGTVVEGIDESINYSTYVTIS